MTIWQQFHGPNAGYILELFERYQQDPNAVDAATRAYFERASAFLQTPIPTNGTPSVGVPPQPPPVSAKAITKIMGVVNLAQAIREYGHLGAKIDPLGLYNPPGDPTLALATYDLTEADLQQLPASLVGGPVAEGKENAAQAIQALRSVYSHTTGYDYDHLRVPEEREWLRHAAESRRFRPPYAACDSSALLERLTQVETFELFLHRIFPGKTRFSIEGLDMMVPMLDEIIGGAADGGIYTILLGMAHRGRLNVLAHILNRPYAKILTEFKDPEQKHKYDERNYVGWTGDVKYHAGERRFIDFEGDDIIDVDVIMAPNPSHLEHVNPVVVGMARATGTDASQPGPPQFNVSSVVPVLIHGDAAFSGQGVVAETLNMHRLRGYRVGGTIHIIANNQVGFTTNYWSSRSTRYASDIAKGFKIPIVHVNADDPEACVEVARLAIAYRQQFQEDFVIDLVGYRRYGHNEGDEPRFTQPRMYQVVEAHPTVRAKWAQTLIERGEVSEAEPEAMVTKHRTKLHDIYTKLEAEDRIEAIADSLEPQLEPPPKGAAKRVKTAVSLDTLAQLNQSLLQVPDDFVLNRKLARAMEQRRQALDDLNEGRIDWATAESLAFASILADGTPIRMTGEDVERGTFSHRHALFRDQENGRVYVPLQNIPEAQAGFEIRNSPLTENAAVGFEYGYNIQAPERLVIWEAQYGDFVNGAQAMIDEFIVSGRAKWEQTPSLVMLLPHGYEGQGPDHSTARLERFLEMAAKTNLRIVYPTTAAQYFHLLRRQAALLKTDPLPLIVMSPKSLLRHPDAVSTPIDLVEGHWQSVINDAQAMAAPEPVTRLILCSGKVYVDLLKIQQRIYEESGEIKVALTRIEQLYSFPEEEVEAVFTLYPNIEEIIWLQEEPANMGAWPFVRPLLEKLVDKRWPVRYIGRPRRASPAEGSTTWHKRNQTAITEHAFKL